VTATVPALTALRGSGVLFVVSRRAGSQLGVGTMSLRRSFSACVIGLAIGLFLVGTALASNHHTARAPLEEKVCAWGSASVQPIGRVHFSRAGNIVDLNVVLHARPNASYTVRLFVPPPPSGVGCEAIEGSFVVSTNARGMGRGTGSFTVNNQGNGAFAAGVFGAEEDVFTRFVSLSA
jgi:hypothetical protein